MGECGQEPSIVVPGLVPEQFWRLAIASVRAVRETDHPGRCFLSVRGVGELHVGANLQWVVRNFPAVLVDREPVYFPYSEYRWPEGPVFIPPERRAAALNALRIIAEARGVPLEDVIAEYGVVGLQPAATPESATRTPNPPHGLPESATRTPSRVAHGDKLSPTATSPL